MRQYFSITEYDIRKIFQVRHLKCLKIKYILTHN